MSQDILSVKEVVKAYNSHFVLNGINFSVKKGDICGLVGLNGIGKTTLIKIIIDLLRADEGVVSFCNVRSTVTAGRSNISYLPEKFNPSSYLTGEEFLKIALGFFNIKYQADIAFSYCKKLGFAKESLFTKVGGYSKGMGQKLGLIATLMSERELLILDEPMSGLDPRARILVKEQMQEYNNKGKTIFFSSHILADVDEICNVIIILHNSKVLFNGPPEQLRSEFNNVTLEKAFLLLIDRHEAELMPNA